MAQNFITRLFSRKAKPKPMVLTMPAYAGGIRRGSLATLQAYGLDGHLRGCVDTVADQVAAVRFRVYKRLDSSGKVQKDYSLAGASHVDKALAIKELVKEGGVVELPEHELSKLLARPCPDMTRSQFFKLVQVHLDLVGEAFVLLNRDSSGRITHLTPIPPTAVSMIPSGGNPFYQVQYENIAGSVPAESMLYFRTLDVAQPHRRGSGLGTTIGTEIDSLEAASVAVKATFQRRGHPSGVISVTSPDGDNEEAVDDLQKRLEAAYQRPDQAGRVLVVSGTLASAAFQIDHAALKTPELVKQIRDFVRETFKVPSELIGGAASANRSATEAALAHLYAVAVAPRVAYLEEALQMQLAPLVDDAAVVLAEDRAPVSYDRRVALMSNPTTAPAFRLNEVRALAEMPPDPELEGMHTMPAPGVYVPTEAPGAAPEAPADVPEAPAEEAKALFRNLS